MIKTVAGVVEPREALVSLAPLETMTIFFMVCVVAGLVLASPWVFYQLWAFVAAGLYRHERHYVTTFLPFSLGLFLTGVLLCFFVVLPITLSFLLEFNVWLGIEPTLRLADWMSFATILPLVFGVCFQTPLVMFFLALIGIFSVEDYRAKRKMAILIIVIAGAVLTPGQDPFSQCLLAAPMILLYELGILLVSRSQAIEHAVVETHPRTFLSSRGRQCSSRGGPPPAVGTNDLGSYEAALFPWPRLIPECAAWRGGGSSIWWVPDRAIPACSPVAVERSCRGPMWSSTTTWRALGCSTWPP